MTLLEKHLLLTKAEETIEQEIEKLPGIEIEAPAEFQNDIAWELANLTRVAYRDYEIFNDKVPKVEGTDTLAKGSKLYLSSEASQDRIYKYVIDPSVESTATHEEVEGILGENYYAYEILTSYNYLAYLAGIPHKPDVDKFGFIDRRMVQQFSVQANSIFNAHAQ